MMMPFSNLLGVIMTSELLAALCMIVFAPLHAIASATANGLSAGLSWGLGNRHSAPNLPLWMIRFGRAHVNLMENLPSFLGVIGIAFMLGVSDHTTRMAAWTFVAARLGFTVVYTAGITFLYLRTVLYYTGVGATFWLVWRILAVAAG